MYTWRLLEHSPNAINTFGLFSDYKKHFGRILKMRFKN